MGHVVAFVVFFVFVGGGGCAAVKTTTMMLMLMLMLLLLLLMMMMMMNPWLFWTQIDQNKIKNCSPREDGLVAGIRRVIRAKSYVHLTD